MRFPAPILMTKNLPLVSVSLVVRNGEKYIRDCLAAVRAQTYQNIEVVVFDNDSTDRTREMVRDAFPEYRLVENKENIYVGSGWNRCLAITEGKYFLGLCVDVVLDRDFVKNAVAVMERDEKIGALQAKIYKTEKGVKTSIIDTAGFEISRSRRIVNRGHGEEDRGQYDQAEEIFSYEGAAPFWRREAIVASAVDGQCHDEDYLWYADDIDLGWRMRLFGWKSFFAPDVIAWHDRQTTKRLSSGKWDFIALRRTIPARKRMLDWRNTHYTFLKNDFFLSQLKHARFFLAREIQLFIYILIFEPYTLLAVPKLIVFLPAMLKKRRYIMRHRRCSRSDMERWFR